MVLCLVICWLDCICHKNKLSIVQVNCRLDLLKKIVYVTKTISLSLVNFRLDLPIIKLSVRKTIALVKEL